MLRPRHAIGLVAVLVFLAGMALPSRAGGPALTLSPSTGPPGTDVDADGSGFTAGEVELFLDAVGGTPLASGTVGAAGTFSLDFVVPDTSPGDHLVLACLGRDSASNRCRQLGRAVFQVTAPTTTTRASTTTTRQTTTTAQPTTTAPGTVATGGSIVGPTTSSTTTSTTDPSVALGTGSTTSSITTPDDLDGPPPTVGVASSLPQFAPNDTPDDLFAYRIEVTQGIQDFGHTMPMIPLRPTFARVYVAAGEGPLPGVRGVLGGIVDGELLGIESAINQPLTADHGGKPRVELDGSLVFRVPAGWTVHGELELRAFVYFGDIGTTFAQDPDLENNLRTQIVGFHDTAIITRLALAPIRYHVPEEAGGSDITWFPGENPDELTQILVGLERFVPTSLLLPTLIPFPVQPYGYVAGEGPVWNIDEDTAEESGDGYAPLNMLELWRDSMDAPYNTYLWYGTLPPSFDWDWWSSSGETTITASGLSNGEVSMGKMKDDPDSTGDFQVVGSKTLAHEVGHDRGLGHYACVVIDDEGNTSEALGGGLDADWPHPAPDCKFAIEDPQGFYGFDIYFDRFAYLSEPAVIANDFDSFPDGQRAWPLMSYGGDKWSDPFTYCQMLTGVGVPCNAYPPPDDPIVQQSGDLQAPTTTELGAGPIDRHGDHAHAPVVGLAGSPAVAGGVATGPWLRLSAVVDPFASTGRLLDVAIVDDVPALTIERSEARRAAMADAGGGAAVVLRDAAGVELARHPVADLVTARRDEPGAGAFPVVLFLDPPAGTAAVQLAAGDALMAERTASPTAPSVTVVEPSGGTVDGDVEVRWEAADADGDALLFDLFHSADGGESWFVVARGVPGTTHVLPAGTLRGSDRSVVRVVASDGFHTATGDSEAFTTPDHGPDLVLITSPADGVTVAHRARVTFAGLATDREQEDPVEDLRWSSSLDGPLGDGAEVATRDLSVGEHEITLTATDPAGNESTATVTVTVDGETSADVPDQETLDRLRPILLTGELPSSGGDGGTWWWLAAGAFVGALVTGGFVLRRRRRSPAR